MSFRGGDYFTAEILNRIGGRFTTSQILPYLNESLGIISAAASFSWDQVEELNVGPINTGLYNPALGSLDSGKKISILNHISQSPISKVPQEEYGLSAAGYVDQAGSEFNSFKIVYPGGGASVRLNFYPSSITGFIDLFYHLLPPTLTITPVPTVRWDVPFMDSVLLDMTEAACKRILSWAGWQDREAAARSKLQEAVRIYSVDRINTGTAQETANAVEEKRQIGRA